MLIAVYHVGWYMATDIWQKMIILAPENADYIKDLPQKALLADLVLFAKTGWF